MELKKSNSNEGVFNSIVGLNVSTADGNMTIDNCKYVFLTENRGKLILNLQYELDIPETENDTATETSMAYREDIDVLEIKKEDKVYAEN